MKLASLFGPRTFRIVEGRLLAADRLDLAPLVTHRFPLEMIDQAFATAVAKPDGVVKAIITMTDPSTAATEGSQL